MNNLYRIEEIKQDIRYFNRMINEANEQITKLRKEIEKLENVFHKYIKIRNEYDEYQYKRSKQSNVLESNFKNIKLSKKLSSDIITRLKGSNANKSSRGIDKTLEDTKQHIRKDEESIKELQNKIQHYQARINELEYELRNLLYEV